MCIAEADVSAFDVRLRYALDPRLRRVLVSVHEAWRPAVARWRLLLTAYLAERVAGLRLVNAGCCREHVLTISNAYGQPGMPQQQQQQQQQLMMVQVPPGATAGTLVSVATPSGQQIQCTCVADAAAACIAPPHEISQSACFTQGARWRGARRDVSSSCPCAVSADHHRTSDRHRHSKTSLIAQRTSRIEEWAALLVPCSYRPPSVQDVLTVLTHSCRRDSVRQVLKVNLLLGWGAVTSLKFDLESLEIHAQCIIYMHRTTCQGRRLEF
eukprot:COSAG01_NODE_4274_length_5190_cov_1.718916_3_plen_269_part_00